jgi:hypothetical protein
MFPLLFSLPGILSHAKISNSPDINFCAKRTTIQLVDCFLWQICILPDNSIEVKLDIFVGHMTCVVGHFADRPLLPALPVDRRTPLAGAISS